MKWQRLIALVAFLLALAILAAWQWKEYRHECDLARQTVSNSADSVMNALVGGVRSHRRLGQFFSENIQGVLDGLVRSKDVRAVALVSEDGKAVLSAGESDLLDFQPPFSSGERWEEAGFCLTDTFPLPSESSGPDSGWGGGRGWGRRWQQQDEDATNSFSSGSRIAAMLLVDRTRADQMCRHSAWLHGSTVAAGSLVLLCLALVWRATVRLAEARGRERSLALETRHFRDLSQAAAGLAHETRNPLGLIRGWTQRLIAQMNSKDGRDQAQAILEECDRVTARINQFLAFARSNEPKLQRFDPLDMVRELVILLDPDLGNKRINMNSTNPGCTILADREMFRQAMFNLLQNAVQASPEYGVVEVAIMESNHGRKRIEVSDDGPGVTGEAVEKLFTPYFTTRTGGTGLGLAIVRRIAAVHGWEVGYTSRPSGGAIFWMEGIHG